MAAVTLIAASTLQCFAVELSVCSNGGAGLLKRLITVFGRLNGYFLVEIMTVLLIDVLLIQIFSRADIALILSSLVTTALAVTNYYVHLLHGTPFTLTMIRDVGTAANVLSSYKLSLSLTVQLILLVGVFNIIAALLILGKRKFSRVRTIPATALMLGVISLCFFIPDSLMPRNVVIWKWDESIDDYGYLNCFVDSTLCMGQVTHKPEGYDREALENFTQHYEVKHQDGQTPDVILILNETFYDLKQVTDIQADKDYMGPVASLKNTCTGYAVVPAVGGGTNKSEYEYLTSNTLQLAPNITPFMALNLNDAASVTSVLKAQGYETEAIHCESGRNYNRQEGYPLLGFDHIHFEEDFSEPGLYCDRKERTDDSFYQELIKWYEEMDDGPRFMYGLTIQNHGGYISLKPEDYLVHTGRDYGQSTSQINEFLTMISLSNEAFVELTEYFEKSDRDVIICMVGDHAPALIREVVDPGMPDEMKELCMRSTPFVIWSNYLDLSCEIPEKISLNYLVPTVLHMAGVTLSPYYDFLLSMRNEVPVISSYGNYITSDGKSHRYGDGGSISESVDTYLKLSYANMNHEPFMKEFTLPPLS